MARSLYRHSLSMFGLLGVLVSVQAHASVTAPQAAAPQPLEVLPSGHPVVQVSIDGSAPRRFVIDTAASSTTIMPKLRAEMPGLVAKPSNDPLDGASGRVDVETAVVGDLQVARQSFRSPELMLLPPGPTDRLGVDGILGADIIADFVVEMDMPGRTWRMVPKLEAGMLDGLTASTPLTLDKHRAPRLVVRVNGVEMPAVLDTGARGTIVNWAGAKAIGLTPDSPGLVKASDIKGATNHATASVETSLNALMIGEAKVEGGKARIADLSVFKELGFGLDQPAVILGIDTFADRRLVIDHPGLRLHISPPRVAAVPQS
ncbi:aspartyl protease family protein [Novosphingobium sp. JCM 18896]|uniref:aspartyl protease family protein n=1 Tax=Novosphingobium sp. JCM 18896 TaxID=2989731 RepID=UPI002222A372|nr:aspartyl protease family protein [Novosphingobium sp. JCM 18896]MCW1431103.1 aspartyl protease family protein [Novosphingobium sp. JCM 18896]